MRTGFAKAAAIAAVAWIGGTACLQAHPTSRHHGGYGRERMASRTEQRSSERVTSREVWDGLRNAPMEIGRTIVILPGRVFGSIVHSPTTTYQVVRGERSLFTPAPEMEKGRLTMTDVSSRTYHSIVNAPATTRDLVTGKRDLLTQTDSQHYQPPV
jgi:hypothetical protein